MSVAPTDRRLARYALALVTLTAIAGFIGCVFGALNWGLLGVSVGLAGAWAMFLLGFFGLYHRQQRSEATVATYRLAPIASATPAAEFDSSGTA
jgi:uncharacterized membrane protein YuzA (DUF378 family)